MTILSRMRALAAGLVGIAGLCICFSGVAQTIAGSRGQLLAAVEPVSHAPLPVHLNSIGPSTGSTGNVSLPVDVAGWIARFRRAAQQQSYTGTLVVTTDAGDVAGSRVWHACRDDQQIERVDLLDGPARTVFRRNGEMRTFLHASREVVEGEVTANAVFPKLLPAQAERLDALYRAQRKGVERVADHDADVVWLVPRDTLRFGYRIWSERGTGLVLRVQTVQGNGRILEQASFLELDLTTFVPFDRLSQAMDDVAGYDQLPSEEAKGSATPDSWRLRSAVPGFVLQGCRTSKKRANTAQCNYGDGLTNVSVFVESFVSGSVPQAAARWSAGATTAIARPLDSSSWLTVVGEVPAATLAMFAERMERNAR